MALDLAQAPHRLLETPACRAQPRVRGVQIDAQDGRRLGHRDLLDVDQNEDLTLRIVELSPIENTQVLTALFMHIRSPEFQCRWRWSDNDLAFWDNRSVQHFAVPDYEDERLMQRIELAGEEPKGSR